LDALWPALEAWGPAAALRGSRWGYAAVNTAHVLGIALLVGAVVPLNLKLMGAWPGVAREVAARLTVPVAAGGLALAASAGVLLFSVRAGEYAATPLFQAKMALVTLGAAAALAGTVGGVHRRGGKAAARTHGAVSLACWLGALVCGRFVAFAG